MAGLLYTEGVNDRARVLAWLEAHLTPFRYRHSLGVAKTARELAQRFGEDPDRCELAGLLHDAAREWPPAKLLTAAHAEGLHVDYLEELAPMPCLHGALGAAVARDEFGVTDDALLAAIAHHTMGRERMTRMEQILFVADTIEPNRGDAPYLADVRAAAQQSLAKACRVAYDHTFDFLLRTGQPIHPDATRGRNWLIYCERRPAPATEEATHHG